MEDADQPKPGWYDDPFGRRRYRYWDGERWSSYAANEAVEWDPIEAETNPDVDEPAPPLRGGVLLAFVGYFVGIGLALAIGAWLHHIGEPGGKTVALIIPECGLWFGLVGACVLVSRRRGTGSLRRDFDWRFRKLDIGLGFAGSIAGRLVSVVIVSPIPLPFRHPEAPDRGIVDRVAHSPFDWAVLFVIVCIGAPLIEELFFRGLLQPRLVEILGPARGLPLTALLFGAAHLTAWQGSLTFVYALAIVGAGLVLGLIRHVSGRLGTSTWAHFFFNAQAIAASALTR